MESFRYGRTSQHFKFLRRQFLQDGNLPFSNVLTVETTTHALEKIDACWNDRIYTPLVTPWVFPGQVLSADHSCRAAVARLIAHLVSQGDSPCCPETGAYCQARKRLPEAFFSTVACKVGRNLGTNVDAGWLWKGRRVYMFDGSTVPCLTLRRTKESIRRFTIRSRPWLSDCPYCSHYFALLWCDPQHGGLSLCRQRTGGSLDRLRDLQITGMCCISSCLKRL